MTGFHWAPTSPHLGTANRPVKIGYPRRNIVTFSRRIVFFTLMFPAPAIVAAQTPVDPRPGNGTNQVPAFAGQTDAPERKSNVAFDVVTVAQGLENPWGLAFLPNGKMLVTE